MRRILELVFDILFLAIGWGIILLIIVTPSLVVWKFFIE